MTYRDSYPRELSLHGKTFTLRALSADDAAPLLDFARCLPSHDLMFLPRDITEPRVVRAWIDESTRGGIVSLVFVSQDRIVASGALVHDTLFWSKHVAEVRIVVDPGARRYGLGRTLLQELFAIALSEKVEKVIAQMTTDQVSAIGIFESMGFKAEAMLRDQVKDPDGRNHDIVLMGILLDQALAQLRALGMLEATAVP